MVGVRDFLGCDVASTGASVPVIRMHLEVVEARAKHRLTFVHLGMRIKVLNHALNQSHRVRVGQIVLNSQARQNENLAQILGPPILVLARQYIETIDLPCQLGFLLRLLFG